MSREKSARERDALVRAAYHAELAELARLAAGADARGARATAQSWRERACEVTRRFAQSERERRAREARAMRAEREREASTGASWRAVARALIKRR